MRLIVGILTTLLTVGGGQAFEVAPVNTDGPGANLPSNAVLDILGLQLGDTLDTARAIILEHSGRDAIEAGIRGTPTRPGGGKLAIDFIQELQSSDDVGRDYMLTPSDRLLVVVASKLFDQRVLMVRRDVVYDQALALTAEDLQAQLVAKYGQPSLSEYSSDGWPSRIVYAFGSNGRHQFSGDYSSMGRERRDSGQPVRYSPNAPCEASIAYYMELAAPPITDGPGVLHEDPDCFAALDIKIDTHNGLLSHAVFVAIDAKRAIAYGTAMAASVNQALANSSGATATLPDL